MKTTAKQQRTRENIKTLHGASAREFSIANAPKYGHRPWGQFYHYVAMELAQHATKPQMDMAIMKALQATEAQETGCRKAREASNG